MRQVAAKLAPRPPDLETAVGAVLDLRLQPVSPRPVAVAISGGGDSLALLLAADAWARRAGRSLLVLTVDHALRPESAGWSAACAAAAARLGWPFRSLAWIGEKPTTGLPAAARHARHALLADAAREGGARVILIGHTADDVLEARRMRAGGSTTPEPRVWSPSPAWPQGRGVFLLRPLLSLSRADLRAWLAARGETWIEDPANGDLRYARARARQESGAIAGPPVGVSAAALAQATIAEPGGGLSVSREALRDADPEAARRFVAAACLCASGTSRPPAALRADRLTRALIDRHKVVATLAGARIEADVRDVRFLREAGEAARGGLAPLQLGAGETGVWDGRFEIAADGAIEIRRLAGHAARLSRSEQAALRALPATARPGLPLVIGPEGAVACPIVAPAPWVRLVALAHDRLLGACGAVECEPA
ncbi:MAG TPA: tRNA lysidine(34) synthetase TilS [Phenylobacterium sp.]